MKKNSFGQGLAILFVVAGVLYVIGSIGAAREPKCIEAGCDNKQASGSCYCYLHKPYTGSSSGTSTSSSSSSYSGKSSSGSTSSSTSSSGSSSSSYNSKSYTTDKSSYSSDTKKGKGAYVPWFGTQLVNGNSLIGARRQVYSQSQLESGKWYNKAPRRIMPGEDRTKKGQHEHTKEIYHFLLGDPGMSSYSEKVIKDLEPESIKKIRSWNKEFISKFDEDELKTVLRLSESIRVSSSTISL